MMLEGSAASSTISLFAAVAVTTTTAATENSFEFLHVECVFLGSPVPSSVLDRLKHCWEGMSGQRRLI